MCGLRAILAGLPGVCIETLAGADGGARPHDDAGSFALAGAVRHRLGYSHCAGRHLEREDAPAHRYGAGRALSGVHGAGQGGAVDVVTGHLRLFVRDETDVALPGRLPIVLARTYCSGSDAPGLLGRGWHTPWEVRLLRQGDALVYLDAQGRAITLPAPALGSQVLVSSEQIRLACLPDGRMVVADLTPHYAVFGDFDASGVARLKYIEDAQQQRIGCIWGDAGELRRVRGLCGHELRLEYLETAAGLRLHAIDGVDGGSAGTLARYGYDAQGMLCEVHNRAGDIVRRFGYRQGLMTEAVDALGAHTRYAWVRVDGSDRVSERLTSEGVHDRFSHDVENRHSQVTTVLGDTAHWQCDARGRVVAHTDFDGRHFRFEYNVSDCPTVLHLPGERAVRLQYDMLGRLIMETDPLGQTEATTYDIASHASVMTQRDDGRFWIRQYDEAGRLTNCQDPAGRIQRIAYAKDGASCTVTEPSGARIVLERNRWGQVTRQVDANGGETRYAYDADGHMTSMTDAAGQTTRFEYNTAIGRPHTVIRPDGHRERLAWNLAGQLLSHTDAEGHERHWRRDGHGRVIRFTDQEGRVTQYAYDAHGRLVLAVNPNGAAEQFDWDPVGRLRARLCSDGVRYAFAYDAAGDLAGVSVFAGGVSRAQILRRDPLGRVVGRDNAHSRYTYEYDRSGRCTQVIRQPTKEGECLGVTADTLRFDYDATGRLTAEHGAEGAVRYPPGGQAGSIVLPDGQRIQMVHDGANGMHRVHFAGQFAAAFRLDGVQREVLRLQGSLLTQTGYNIMGLPVRQRTIAAAGASSGPEALAREHSLLWTDAFYSANGRLLRTESHAVGTTYYDYDRCGRLLRRILDGQEIERFAWDPAGNPIDTQQITADWQAAVCPDNKPGAYSGIQYDYDAWGYVIRKRSRTGETRFEWDAEGRLLAVHCRDHTVRYQYDAIGRRIGRRLEVRWAGHPAAASAQSPETRFVWGGRCLVQERSGTRVRTYLYHPGRGREPGAPVAFADQMVTEAGVGAPLLRHCHADGAGTVMTLTDDDGKVLWSASYKAWGNVTPRVGGIEQAQQPLRFAGQHYDALTGLHHSLLRDYDPDIGRFLSPRRGLAQVNPYAYAPNPLTWRNPLGGDCVPLVALALPGLRRVDMALDSDGLAEIVATQLQDIAFWDVAEFGIER